MNRHALLFLSLRSAKTVFAIAALAGCATGLNAASGLQGNSNHARAATQIGELPSPESLATLLESALSRGQETEAKEILGRVLVRPQLDSDILLRVGIQLAQQALYAEAAQVFARCIREHPAIPEGYYNLALALIAQQKFVEALKALQNPPHGTDAENASFLYLRGKAENALGNTAEAGRDLAVAFSTSPQEENYALDLGMFYLQQDAYPKAIEVFQRGATLNPSSVFLTLGLSLAQLLGGQIQESLESTRKLLSSEPHLSAARLLVVVALYRLGRNEQAEKIAAVALNEADTLPYLAYLHAKLLLQLQSADTSRILADLDIANRGMPNCGICYVARSEAHEHSGDTQAAISELETAVRVEPDFAEGWYHLASLYKGTGQIRDAARALATFKKISSDKRDRENEALRRLFVRTLNGRETDTR